MWVSVLTLHLEPCSEDDGSATSSGSVDGALVEALGLSLGTGSGSHVHDGQDGMQLLQLHLSEVALLATAAILPTSTFKEEAGNVGTILSELRVFSFVLGVGNIGNQAHVIERKTLLTGSHLHDGSQVGHGVEKSRNPDNRWGLKSLRPDNKLGLTLTHVSEPVEE